jgi:thioredoxin type arsenate reductase
MTTAILSQPPSFLKLLAHELRWQLVETLARSDRRVHELVQMVGEPTNLVSYHLRQLRGQSLVTEHRSAADGRDIYYSLNLDRLRHLYFATGESLHPGLAENPDEMTHRSEASPTHRVRVLFLCTHNSARSQMAEAILREIGGARVETASAGTEVTRVHPLAVREMKERGIDISEQRSKHMDEFLGESFDYVVTVCDNAREACPIFPGAPERIHWSIPDPSAVTGDEAKQRSAFKRAADELTTRLRYFLALIEKEGR